MKKRNESRATIIVPDYVAEALERLYYAGWHSEEARIKKVCLWEGILALDAYRAEHGEIPECFRFEVLAGDFRSVKENQARLLERASVARLIDEAKKLESEL